MLLITFNSINKKQTITVKHVEYIKTGLNRVGHVINLYILLVEGV